MAKNGAVNGVESSKLIATDQRQSLAFEATGSLFYQLILTLGEDSSAVS